MRTIKLADVADPGALAEDVAEVLRAGELVCLPCAGRYRLVATLEDAAAVTRLIQAKSRIKKAPALVFVDGEAALDRVAEHVPAAARRIANALWPQPVTIRVAPSQQLPARVLKELGGKKARLGVRTPDEELMKAVVRAAGTPLLVSSANREKKAGESSPAQVKKTFGGRIALFLDGGDLQPGPISTVVEVDGDEIIIERAGAIDAETIERSANG